MSLPIKLPAIVIPINLVLLSILAFVLVQLIWLLLAVDNNQAINIKNIAKTDNKTIQQPKGLTLFGEVEIIEALPLKKTIIGETKLNLVLKGVWLNQEKLAKSYVIIELSGEDKIFYLNDKISSLAKLVEIYANYVVLERSGQLEALYLRKEEESATLKSTPAKPSSKKTFTPKLNRKEKQKLKKIKSQLKNNPWRLSKVLNIKPKYRSGQLQGFEIRPGKERSLFYRLGFKPGDIVYSVNNSALTLATLNTVLNTVIVNNDIYIGFYRDNISQTLLLKL